MGKYTDIVGKSWETINLIPESIPHLFHWDLAYLWILEKESKLRPRIWQDRIEAWKYLVAGLLVGELQVSEEPLKNPFLQFVLPFGVEKVSWVSLPKTGEKIGVLSPTVLVRPLPDYNDQLSKWTKTLPDPIVNQSDRLAYFIQLLVSKTTSGSVIPPFFQRFCDILASEFHTNQKISNRFAGKEQKILIMNRFSWEVANTEPFQVPMSIYVFDARKSASNTFIPKCASCRGFLLNGKEDEPLAIKANSISLKCRKCSKENEIKLDDLLIWNRESQKQLIVWEQENQEIAVLPERHIEPDLIICEWNPAEVDSESHRFLHITANTSKILKTKIKDIFYRELLVPGDFEEFQGLPIRLEWLDALVNKNLVPEIDVAGKTITYSLHLKGIPKPVLQSFGSLKINLQQSLSFGVYPNPNRVPPEWKWFRYFLQNENQNNYRVITNKKNTPIFPWLIESKEGQLDVLSIIEDKDETHGVTYLRHRSLDLPVWSDGKLYLGLDFGTTNTILYYQGGKGDNMEPSTQNCGFQPGSICQSIDWIAQNSQSKATKNVIGGFLPNSQYGADRSDGYLIPSALWEFDNQFLIRWSDQKPNQKAIPRAEFKWDNEYYEHRLSFLRELLLVSLPRLVLTDSSYYPSIIKLGFSYPLAFDDSAMKNQKKLLNQLGEELKTLTGASFEPYFIDESLASVRAFGSHNASDVFLVADMGGGTLDVSLFTQNGSEILQIGSIKYAGGNFIKAISHRSTSQADQEQKQKKEWEIRDQIFFGAGSEKLQSEVNTKLLGSFSGLAFEFIRTMLQAYRKELIKPIQRVNLVLVGNGWRLVEVVNPETKRKGGRRVFQDYYSHVLEQIGDIHFQFTMELPRGIENSKHLVALGAMKNAKEGSSNISLKLSKLPAGRPVTFKPQDSGKPYNLGWEMLVGDDIPIRNFTRENLSNGDIDVQTTFIPEISESWAQFLKHIFGVKDFNKIPYPTEAELREEIKRNLTGLAAPTLQKGPLQIILERRWGHWLANPEV